MKVAEGAVVTFFTDPGFTGQHVDVTQSVEGGGINFSCVKIWESSNELDDDALDAVVGGRGGIDAKDGKKYGCACVLYGQGGDGRAKDANCRCYFGGAGSDSGTRAGNYRG